MFANGETKWYLIDNHILGKVTDSGCFLFKNGVWEKDTNHVIMDCLFGYDPTEDEVYALGNIEIMDRIKEITLEEAHILISKQQHKKSRD